MELIPHTKCLFRLFEILYGNILMLNSGSGWRGQRSDKSKFFWEPEVHDMAEQLQVLENGIKSQKSGSKQALADFMKARKKLVEARVAVCLDFSPR